MTKHRSRFEPFCAVDFDEYLASQKESGTWGDDIEIKAIEEIFDRRVVIYNSESPFLEPMRTNFDEHGSAEVVQPIVLSYHGQQHYNSVFNEKVRLPLSNRRVSGSGKILAARAKSMTSDAFKC